ncbi:hypothetical protein M885DRAFT_508577 [Pelagophyceae sp. CCMP2097]|nr:hypothetical protein M885DRAFT_508577 [Pelagophyceae sp. CCMP2097]
MRLGLLVAWVACCYASRATLPLKHARQKLERRQFFAAARYLLDAENVCAVEAGCSGDERSEYEMLRASAAAHKVPFPRAGSSPPQPRRSSIGGSYRFLGPLLFLGFALLVGGTQALRVLALWYARDGRTARAGAVSPSRAAATAPAAAVVAPPPAAKKPAAAPADAVAADEPAGHKPKRRHKTTARAPPQPEPAPPENSARRRTKPDNAVAAPGVRASPGAAARGADAEAPADVESDATDDDGDGKPAAAAVTSAPAAVVPPAAAALPAPAAVAPPVPTAAVVPAAAPPRALEESDVAAWAARLAEASASASAAGEAEASLRRAYLELRGQFRWTQDAKDQSDLANRAAEAKTRELEVANYALANELQESRQQTEEARRSGRRAHADLEAALAREAALASRRGEPPGLAHHAPIELVDAPSHTLPDMDDYTVEKTEPYSYPAAYQSLSATSASLRAL